MADKLFYTYNSGGTASNSEVQSNAHTYSQIFDTNRHSIWAGGVEYGYNTDYQCTSSGHYTPQSSMSAGTVTGTATGNLSNGGSFTVPSFTYDAKGHIKTWTTNTLTLPSITSAHNGTLYTYGDTGKQSTFSANQSTASILNIAGSGGVSTAVTKSGSTTTVTITGTGGSTNCVTYNSSDSPGVHEIRVVATPGTAANTLYIIL